MIEFKVGPWQKHEEQCKERFCAKQQGKAPSEYSSFKAQNLHIIFDRYFSETFILSGTLYFRGKKRYHFCREKNLISSENWFKKFGPLTVLLARFVPLIRTPVAFSAGIAEMKIPKFLAYSIIGIVLWMQLSFTWVILLGLA